MKSYSKQTISDADIKSVEAVMRSEMLTQGPAVDLAEKKFCEKLEVSHCVLVNSATSALHLAMLALGVGAGSRVWTVSNTFVASANAPRYSGADLGFCDIDLETLNIDVDNLRDSLERSSLNGSLPDAVIVVHFAGSSCEMVAIRQLSVKFNFRVIEDASHAIGGKYLDRYIGDCLYSDACIFSFHPVKIITSGEGGAVTTNDEDVARKLKLLRSHGVSREKAKFSWEYEQKVLGYNYRMPDINAALLRSQLLKLDELVKKRNALAQIYKDAFRGTQISFQFIPRENLSAYHLFTVALPIKSLEEKEKFKTFLQECGIGTQVHYIPVHTQAFHMGSTLLSDMRNTNLNYVRTLSLPLYPALEHHDVNFIINKIRSYKFD